ncbi:MAG: sodium-dependent transporter [Methylococcaceae bacterium TMED69]|nr:MAG: sodium-dependent transporter [Methylococcaceae bacterium TMED69]
MRASWSSPWLFILAATGSAVGLGNIWRFPYVTGENGGGAFVLLYLFFVFFMGLPILFSEILIGKRAQKNPINAMKSAALESGAGQYWKFIGAIGVLAGCLILSFYSVIAGWCLAYVYDYVTVANLVTSFEEADEKLDYLTNSPIKLITWHTLFMLVTVVIVARGLKRGFELATKYLMPVLFATLLLLVGHAVIVGDFSSSISYLFEPDFSRLTSKTILLAMGQAFFSLSIGMGAIMAYGSYLPTGISVGKCALSIAIADTSVALLAGLAIFPIVFAYGLEPAQGPGLVFVTLNVGFSEMANGRFFGLVFFLLLTIAAWTSSISLIEPGIAWLSEVSEMSRKRASVFLGLTIWLVGLGSVFSFNLWSEFKFIGMNIFEIIEFVSTSLILPFGGMMLVLFVGWFMKRNIVVSELNLKTDSTFTSIFFILMKFLAPLGVLIVLIENSGIRKLVF